MHTKIKTTKKKLSQNASELMPSKVGEQTILHERAERLAIQKTNVNEIKKDVNYVCFRLGQRELYGIPYHSAKEVLNSYKMTQVPFVPDYIAGVINHRGLLLPILNIKKLLQLQGKTAQTKENGFIIIVYANKITMGILVDNIEGDDSFDSTNLEIPSSPIGKIKADYVIGLHKGKIAILNVDSIILDVASQLSEA